MCSVFKPFFAYIFFLIIVDHLTMDCRNTCRDNQIYAISSSCNIYMVFSESNYKTSITRRLKWVKLFPYPNTQNHPVYFFWN